MANQDRYQNSQSQSPDDLARRLQSLLEEPWSPTGDAQTPEPAPSVQQTAPVQEKRPPQPLEKPIAPRQKKTPAPVRRPRESEKQEEQEAQAQPRSRPESWLFILRDVAMVLAVLTLVFTFALRTIKVDGDSMYPSLVDKDQIILLNRMWCGKLQRGDIVVARVPEFSPDPIVKRVIAVAGDAVDIDFERGVVLVNGTALEEPYVNSLTTRSFGDQGTVFPLTVEKGHVFLLGDNRNNSYDSRYASIGQVDERCVIGQAVALAFPGWDTQADSLNLSRIGRID